MNSEALMFNIVLTKFIVFSLEIIYISKTNTKSKYGKKKKKKSQVISTTMAATEIEST